MDLFGLTGNVDHSLDEVDVAEFAIRPSARAELLFHSPGFGGLASCNN